MHWTQAKDIVRTKFLDNRIFCSVQVDNTVSSLFYKKNPTCTQQQNNIQISFDLGCIQCLLLLIRLHLSCRVFFPRLQSWKAFSGCYSQYSEGIKYRVCILFSELQLRLFLKFYIIMGGILGLYFFKTFFKSILENLLLEEDLDLLQQRLKLLRFHLLMFNKLQILCTITLHWNSLLEHSRHTGKY